MGTDINEFVERFEDGKWVYLDGDLFPENEYCKPCPFDGARSYSLFGFLADVRNYSNSPVIHEPRGLPSDVSAELFKEYGYPDEYCGQSWFTAEELLNYDYEQTFMDLRRDPPELTTVRDFLGWGYFEAIDRLAALADNPAHVRLIVGFDC